MLRIEGSEYFGRMVDGDILKLYVKGTVEETHQKYATDAVVELLRPTLEVEVRVQKYPVRGLHKAGTRAKKRNFNFCTKLRPLRGNPRQSWILDSSMWIPHSFSVEIGFRITIISGIPDSKVLDSGLYRQKLKNGNSIGNACFAGWCRTSAHPWQEPNKSNSFVTESLSRFTWNLQIAFFILLG